MSTASAVRTGAAAVRPWDGFDAYLFDIDGTLLHCRDAVHYFAFCDTLTSIAGRPLTLEGVTAHGNTDVGILRDALARAGVHDSVWRPELQHILDAMCGRVRARKQEFCVEVLPQARAVLDHLRARSAVLGVATGNLQGIGEIKLQRAGLLDYFDFAGWSDAFEWRADVIRAAVLRARDAAGENAAICAVGDTPADVRAARENGIASIAVATGIYSIEELRAEQPDYCVPSLAELTSAVQGFAA